MAVRKKIPIRPDDELSVTDLDKVVGGTGEQRPEEYPGAEQAVVVDAAPPADQGSDSLVSALPDNSGFIPGQGPLGETILGGPPPADAINPTPLAADGMPPLADDDIPPPMGEAPPEGSALRGDPGALPADDAAAAPPPPDGPSFAAADMGAPLPTDGAPPPADDVGMPPPMGEPPPPAAALGAPPEPMGEALPPPPADSMGGGFAPPPGGDPNMAPPPGGFAPP
ncbi:MAG: hypothetical protein FJX60_20440, partial [Alphaproteobacteria bacterium]|nr:hypothetical protein [Alphaproteobacteria bacterium]